MIKLRRPIREPHIRYTSGWTWGAEHEFADFATGANKSRPLPLGCTHDRRDYTIVNSNGIANDPRGELYQFGGEINTAPTRTIAGQVKILEALMNDLKPTPVVNYRSNLHIHVMVPGLKDNHKQLLSLYNASFEYLPWFLPHVDPIPEPNLFDYPDNTEYNGALRRYQRMLVSHRYRHNQATRAAIMASKDAHEFMTKRYVYFLAPRPAINIRQIRETGTVEFRCFFGTTSPQLLENVFLFVEDFMINALCYTSKWDRDEAHEYMDAMITRVSEASFPQCPPYNHMQECRYYATQHRKQNSKETIRKNINAILDGTFDDAKARKAMQRTEREKAERACALPR